MNCRKVSHLLSAYMDGELAGVENLQIRQHLSNCDDCNDEYEELLGTKTARTSQNAGTKAGTRKQYCYRDTHRR